MAKIADKLTVRCAACELKQDQATRCRRCGHTLPKLVVNVVMRTVDEAFGPTAPVIPLREVVRRACEHAIQKSSSVSEAAGRLGIGKTTLYRMIHRWACGNCGS